MLNLLTQNSLDDGTCYAIEENVKNFILLSIYFRMRKASLETWRHITRVEIDCEAWWSFKFKLLIDKKSMKHWLRRMLLSLCLLCTLCLKWGQSMVRIITHTWRLHSRARSVNDGELWFKIRSFVYWISTHTVAAFNLQEQVHVIRWQRSLAISIFSSGSWTNTWTNEALRSI